MNQHFNTLFSIILSHIDTSLILIIDLYVPLLTRIIFDFGNKNTIIIFMSFPNRISFCAMYFKWKSDHFIGYNATFCCSLSFFTCIFFIFVSFCWFLLLSSMFFAMMISVLLMIVLWYLVIALLRNERIICLTWYIDSCIKIIVF